jgi:hypothetical protein
MRLWLLDVLDGKVEMKSSIHRRPVSTLAGLSMPRLERTSQRQELQDPDTAASEGERSGADRSFAQPITKFQRD